VNRKKGCWQLLYGAWEDFGNGRQVAEVCVSVGRIGTLSQLGVSGSIRCFAPAIRERNPQRGKLHNSSRIVLKAGNTNKPSWEKPDKAIKTSLNLVGSDPVKSLRATIGLSDKAAEDLKDKKVGNKFLPPINSRNHLTHYNKNWKSWPGTIEVSGDPSNQVNGTFKKLDCQHTVVLSALWRREGEKPMYLYFRPNVLRAALDVAVFSSTPSYKDGLEVMELEDWIPENALSENRYLTSAKLLNWKNSSLMVKAPVESMVLMGETLAPFHDSLTACSSQLRGPVLCEMMNFSKESIESLLEFSVANEMKQSTFVELDLKGKFGTRNARKLSVLAAPSLLKIAAEGKLPLSLKEWYRLPSISNLGKCTKNVPLLPEARWVKNRDVYERVYDAKKSNEYYQVSHHGCNS
jgi:hypothetical protein